ncbi:MAG: hypothetical protein ABI564_01045 [Ideonella sp.]
MNQQNIGGSRLLTRLDSDIRKTYDPVDSACLRAERAMQLARLGQFDKAHQEMASLHAGFDRLPTASVSAWICLAEGCIAYFSSLSSAARDKMQRAHAISAAANLTRIRAISAAWLAHMDFAQFDLEATSRHAREALELADPSNLAAISRACLVVGVAYHFANRLDLAQPWFVRSRECASAEGDEATLSAVIYNIAAYRGNHALQNSLFGGDSSEHARQALAGADSTDNLGQWVGITSLDALVPMLRAVIHSVQGEHDKALALYQAHWLDAKRQGLGRLSANYLADMAWCRWNRGDVDGARRDAASAGGNIDPSMHADDRAVAHGRLAQVYRAIGEIDNALQHEGKARESWNVHKRLQARAIELLADLPAPGSPVSPPLRTATC